MSSLKHTPTPGLMTRLAQVGGAGSGQTPPHGHLLCSKVYLWLHMENSCDILSSYIYIYRLLLNTPDISRIFKTKIHFQIFKQLISNTHFLEDVFVCLNLQSIMSWTRSALGLNHHYAILNVASAYCTYREQERRLIFNLLKMSVHNGSDRKCKNRARYTH